LEQPAQNNATIIIRGLRKSFGGREILHGVDLDVRPNTITCIAGQSGGGKTTICRMLMRISPPFPPDAGSIIVGGKDLVAMEGRDFERELAGGLVGYVFQGNALWTSYSVYDNIALQLRELSGKSGPEIDSIVRRAMADVGLDFQRFADAEPFDLASGEAKKVAIARMLAFNPRIKIYDEPTTGYDLANLLMISKLIREVHDRFGGTSLVVTHDLACIYTIADDVVMIKEGQIHFHGSLDEFRSSTDPYLVEFTRT